MSTKTVITSIEDYVEDRKHNNAGRRAVDSVKQVIMGSLQYHFDEANTNQLQNKAVHHEMINEIWSLTRRSVDEWRETLPWNRNDYKDATLCLGVAALATYELLPWEREDDEPSISDYRRLPGVGGARDTLHHFFASAFIARAFEGSADVVSFVGREHERTAGRGVDENDITVNDAGAAFGPNADSGKPSDYMEASR